MRQELDNLLCSKYPKLFANRNKPMTETCMCWGFSCGDGWYNIINHLCHLIQSHIDWKQEQKEKYNRGEGCEQVVVDQVKEKFGTLRFYFQGGDDYISGAVAMAESLSAVTCESCGGVGERGGNGWVRTICKPCEEKRNKQIEEELAEYKKSRTENDLA